MLGWALNEEANVSEYVVRAEAFLRSATDDFELVLIDDGSTDATWALMNELASTRPWLKLLQNPLNRGSGYCYRRAIDNASKAHFLAQTTVLELRVAQADLGKVIGKQGRTARAVRTILGAAGMKLRKRFVLEILDVLGHTGLRSEQRIGDLSEIEVATYRFTESFYRR